MNKKCTRFRDFNPGQNCKLPFEDRGGCEEGREEESFCSAPKTEKTCLCAQGTPAGATVYAVWFLNEPK